MSARGEATGKPRCSVAAAIVLATAAATAAAGPVDVYREGPRFCPRDRPADGAPLTEGQAIERAHSLLPDDFCGPTALVSGCDVVPEYAVGAWRIYFHQYRLHGARRDWGGLTHTYVILDPVGNCYANIPGTEQGAPR
ncbi:MAG TPA: hypothetical protein VF059_13675 [Casimicrobiaceae bacterium]